PFSLFMLVSPVLRTGENLRSSIPIDKYAPFGKYEIMVTAPCASGFSRGIAGKWKPLIIYFLIQGPNRYGELKRAVRGVSDKMLIQQLKELEADGIITRKDYKEVPPRVDHTL